MQDWLLTFSTRVIETPPGKLPAEALLPVYFNREIGLQAYQTQRQGDTLTIITAWLLDQPLPVGAQRYIAINLVDGAGKSVQKDSSLPVDLHSLQSGDTWLQVNELTLASLATSTYRVELSVYDAVHKEQLRTWGGASEVQLEPLTLP